MRRYFALLPLLCLLSGCYADGNHRVEINQDAGQILPVSALAIDQHDNGYQMTVESIRQDSLDGDAQPAYFTVEEPILTRCSTAPTSCWPAACT